MRGSDSCNGKPGFDNLWREKAGFDHDSVPLKKVCDEICSVKEMRNRASNPTGVGD
jgi:hypothetical protein